MFKLYDTFQKVNNKGWSAPLLFSTPQRQVFLHQGPYASEFADRSRYGMLMYSVEEVLR